ncbi:exonuclease domain-containing protein [Fictibacillus sp. Mic-4]|uniref:exonuclease domain-containing protein n=1 Tax=Fictibacillus sp. Mic-4 TaxID=3132826 RepID=UPI003CEDB4CC
MLKQSTIGMAACIDIETTGLSIYKEEIIELAIVLFTFNRPSGEVLEIIDEYCELNEPSKPVSPGAANVHGIRQEDLIGKRLDNKRIENMMAQADLLVAHNASFEKGFLKRYFPLTSDMPWHCSMNGIQWKQYGFTSKKLGDLLFEHNIHADRLHRALDDVRATIHLISQKNAHGDFYFKELLQKPMGARAKVSKKKKTKNYSIPLHPSSDI